MPRRRGLSFPLRRVSSAWLLAVVIGAMVPDSTSLGQAIVLDDFEQLDQWTVLASDGVKALVSQVNGRDGRGLRLDFEFQSGAGFCVVRRAVPMDLPANYRFTFAIRGEAPSNNLEFKLIDPAGENVWWVNRRGFEFPEDWRVIAYKARHFRFAWGPSAGQPLVKLGSIEFAVSAGSGGRGSIWLDRLTFETLPPDQPAAGPFPVSASSVRDGDPTRPLTLDEAGGLDWHSNPSDAQPWVEIDFRQLREFGGLVIDWDADDYATSYIVALSNDGTSWETVASIRSGNGGRDYLPMPDAEARRVRLKATASSRGLGVAIRAVQVKNADFAQSPNSLLQAIARDAPRGRFPRYFLGEQAPWTIVGVADDDKEGLLSTDGALEVDKLGFSLEPFLLVGAEPHRLITWADAKITQSLEDEYLPIPSVHWRTEALELDITAFADGAPGASTLIARYRLHNRGDQPQTGALILAIRPFQVLPPWQELNITGGVTSIARMVFDKAGLVVNDSKVVLSWSAPTAFGAASFAQGDVGEYLAAGQMPPEQAVTDPHRLASGALQYAFELKPGEHKTVVVAVPFHDPPAAPALGLSEDKVEALVEQRLRTVADYWRGAVNRVGLTLPPSAAKLVNTFKTTQAYILINRDGPSIQPGSRTYERSWMRDGALTSTALLTTGHAEQVKDFLEWFAAYQYPNGKVPCVVDARGADPVAEHDSTGELIYALLEYYRFTRDRAFLEAHWPRVQAGVDYLESLCAQRLTDAYRDGPPDMRACYGLVPESISHEGYSAKPMHSYWDDFFTLRGLKDATTVAEILGYTEAQARFAALAQAFQAALYDSMRLAMRLKGVDYIPGCVELGDFDATSTAIGVFPGGELGRIPEPALTRTFERYWEFFCRRRVDAIEWRDYTPYEVRLVGTFVPLGWRTRAHELLEFFFQDQQPRGWNQWAEVVWRDPQAPRYIGDMPHTWVGSDYLNAARSLFMYERESDSTVVLAAGVLPEWLTPPGVALEDFPTEYGRLSYRLSADQAQMVLDLRCDWLSSPPRLLMASPDPRPIRGVNVDGHPHTDFGPREVVLPPSARRVVIDLEP
ncbi:MAG: discoidin domain-containing protein [Planctomycetota bacterium]